MGEAVGSMLASAVAIAFSPLPLITVVLILATPRGRTNGLAFAAGWALGLAAPVAAVLAAGTALNRTEPLATWSSWVKLGLGVLLVLSAAQQWHDRPRAGHITAPPSWLRAVDRYTAARSAGLGLTLVGRSPKTLLPALGGAVSIVATGTGAGTATATAATTGVGTEAVAAALMVVIASLCTLLPLAVRLRGGEHSARRLGEWRAWTSAHSSAVLITVPAVLGTGYVGDAISGLT
ncbi:Sap-like sulfolipid-1-addressing protein [Streptomyces sp. 1114.5]|uniref:GAP family protein n=1 Tax=unclassified Streptomyces TaxID=2593676 RepID=UPI000BD7DBFA|nr:MULTISPECIES: GAP family protein [unclassified Streptomyces]RKT08768.1 Sap-like sulfolipid-1-addressing protein [Streptomyces sp. 1114.5]SOB79011.1 Sap, sulfolipid-1-addressing protein [Streptomyces sp. 1331.2]